MISKIFISILLLIGIFALEYFSSQSYQAHLSVELSGSIQTGSSLSKTGGVYELSDSMRSKIDKILKDSEVQETLDRIDQIKPRYRQDNAIFMNREKNLESQSDKTYYHEWTVETPGSGDRGPRRIIIGKGGEVYFTDDHYTTFTRIR